MATAMKGAGQETQEVGEAHKFDEAALATYLARELPGFDGELTVRKFGYGQSNPTYMLQTSAGQRYVLRKRPPGKIIRGAHAVDREFRVMRALGREGFEVPEVLLLCEDEAVIGTSWYIMRFVQGPIPDNALAKVNPQSRRAVMTSIAQALARLHKFDPAKLGLLDPARPFGRVGGFYTRQLATMERTSVAQVEGAGGAVPEMPSMPPVVRLFKANMPKDMSCVIHGDWKPDNIIFSNDDPTQVAGVIDWEMSTIGHPMSDLANLCLAYHLPEGNPVGYPVFDKLPEGCIPPEEEVHQIYGEAAGLPYPIADWGFFIAFACFRLAVVMQGIAMRAAKGQASAAAAGPSSEQAVAQLVTAANFMCDLSLEIMRKSYETGAGSKL